MSTLKIHVRNENGEKVQYENNFVPVSKYLEYLDMQAELEDETKGLTEHQKMVKQIEFIASLFQGLTLEKMVNGLEMSELNNIVGEVFVKLVGGEPDPKMD